MMMMNSTLAAHKNINNITVWYWNVINLLIDRQRQNLFSLEESTKTTGCLFHCVHRRYRARIDLRRWLDYMIGRGTVNIAVKQLGGCIVLAYSVIAWGDPLFATRGQWRRRAGDSDETPPIDLLLLYCVRRPTVFSRFLVCPSHKPKESNVQLCSEHS